jgi:hypothetical protein
MRRLLFRGSVAESRSTRPRTCWRAWTFQILADKDVALSEPNEVPAGEVIYA